MQLDSDHRPAFREDHVSAALTNFMQPRGDILTYKQHKDFSRPQAFSLRLVAEGFHRLGLEGGDDGHSSILEEVLAFIDVRHINTAAKE